MTAARFRVKRPFHLDGRVARTDEVVQIEDRHLIASLMNAGRIEPTEDTARVLKGRDTVTFTTMNDDERQRWQPAVTGRMHLAGRM